MIEEALLKSNYIGKDGFSWWLGQIAHQRVWKEKSLISKSGNWGNRCKVRIIGYHPFDPKVLADDDLPWAQVMLDPSFGSSQGGIGGTIDLQGGEACFGFFLDGDDAQQPVVVGLLYRSEGVKNIIDSNVVEKERGSRFKPFTGHPGNYVAATHRDSRAPKTLGEKETPPVSLKNFNKVNFNSNSGFSENSQFGVDTSGLNTDFEKLSDGTLKPQYGDAIRGLYESIPAASTLAVEKKADITLVEPTGCQNNLISQISQILQDFMAITNGLDKYINVYIDPVLNEVVNVSNLVRNTTRQIVGVIKLIISNLRGSIFKWIVLAFRKLVGLVIPPPQQTIVLEAMKKYLDIIFCILENLPSSLLKFVSGLVKDLVDRSVNAPLCAVEQWTAGILSKVMKSIEDSLNNIISGINWLTNGIQSISDILNKANSLASQIFRFLDCTGLACKKPSVWASKFGPSEKKADDWQKMVSGINVFKGVTSTVGSIESALRETPLYSAKDTFGNSFGGLIDNAVYGDCKSKVTNSTDQDDLTPAPIGLKYPVCVPPIVRIVGGGGDGAKAIPIVGSDGSIFSIKIINKGIGYTFPPTISIVDNSGYGIGARAKAIVSNGYLDSIYVIDPGKQYCPDNYNNLFENEEGQIGIGTAKIPTSYYQSVVPNKGQRPPNNPQFWNKLDTQNEEINNKIKNENIQSWSNSKNYEKSDIVSYIERSNLKESSSVNGCVKSIIVISPGYGYTSGDTLTDGKNIYTLVVSPNSGAIVEVNLPKTGSICGFETIPTLTINTNTGVAAELIPLMEYVTSYSSGIDSDLFTSQVGIGVTSVIDCV